MSAVDVQMATPDQRSFHAHLERVPFQAGVDHGRWRVVGIAWPHAIIAVAAAPRPDSPAEFHLRMELTGYPQQAPIITAWDPVADGVLAARKRPRGEIVSVVFRADWEHGRALYAPYDRIALQSHPNWAREYPGQAWNSSRDIIFVVSDLHRLLNSDDYQGASR